MYTKTFFYHDVDVDVMRIQIREYKDGVMIDLGGESFNVEYHNANVQIWRDKYGNVVAIDITYDENK